MSAIDQLSYYQKKLAYEIDSSDLHTALTNNENIVVIDGRSKEVYDHEHIPGAISLPHKEISFNTPRI